MTYVRYADELEKPEPDEQASIDGIIAGMTSESQAGEKREGEAVPASHAESTACVVGKLAVNPGSAARAGPGLFATPGAHLVAVRFAREPGERLGDRVSTHRGMAIKVFDPHADEDGFRHAAIDSFNRPDAMFEPRAQHWANADTQPIEDTSVERPAQDSQYRMVATIRSPRQDAYSSARVRCFDEVMTFRPAHRLAAHRPLGGVMRARLQVDQALSAFRHRENGVAEASPSNIDEVPA